MTTSIIGAARKIIVISHFWSGKNSQKISQNKEPEVDEDQKVVKNTNSKRNENQQLSITTNSRFVNIKLAFFKDFDLWNYKELQ